MIKDATKKLSIYFRMKDCKKDKIRRLLQKKIQLNGFVMTLLKLAIVPFYTYRY